MTKGEIMPKLKDIALGIIVAPLLIPIMLIASYQDKKALKKSWMNAKKKKTRHPDYSIELIKVVEH
jgi:hypothetical protein